MVRVCNEAEMRPDDEIHSTKTNQAKIKDTSESDMETKWVAFSEPTPHLVQVRFNIEEIEIPHAENESGNDGLVEKEDDTFLKMLIDEGIPVTYLPTEELSDEPLNVGSILHPSDPLVEETINQMPENAETAEEFVTVNSVDNIVEVISCNKPTSTPLFFHIIPSQSQLHLPTLPDAPPPVFQVGSIDPSVIAMPPSTTTLPVKKKVRFNLPGGRKSSLVGEYQILDTPVASHQMSDRTEERLRKNSMDSGLPRRKDWFIEEKKPVKKKLRIQENPQSRETQPKSDVRGLFYPCADESDDTDVDERDDEDDNDDDSDSETDIDTRCGLMSWTPDWLQKFARSECYLVVFCLVALAQGMLYTYNISVISTIQKRFHLSSTQTGIILSGNDLAQILISLVVAFYGASGNRPKWLGTGAILSAFSALIAASPKLFFGTGDQDALSGGLLNTRNKFKLELCGFEFSEDCSNNVSPVKHSSIAPVIVLFLSHIMAGVANSIFWTIGVSYLDDNVNKKKTSLHIAMFTIARVLGPAIGFILGGYCLSFWIDPTQDTDLTPMDPRWLGAWWLGFLILSLLIGVPGSFYFCFPRKLPRKRKKTYYSSSPAKHSGENNALYNPEFLEKSFDSTLEEYEGFPSILELPKGLKRLFTNKVWTANMLSNVFFVLAMSGYWAFKPKYIQTQFRKNASTANFYTGMTTMLASVVGIALSGVVLRWVRPKTNHVTAYNVFLSMYAIVSLFALMTIHCPTTELAGHLPGQEKWACSKHCNCSETFTPVCAEDGVTTFYSPCFAGCSTVNLHVNPVEYVNCTCFGQVKWLDDIDENSYIEQETAPFTVSEGWAVHGFCPDNCNALTIYLIIQLVNKVIFATGRIGGTLINLRSVAESDKTLALGCQAMFVSFAGFIPASFVIGSAIDSTCLVWDKICGERGSCSFYDTDKFRLVIHIIPAVLLLLSGVGDLIVHVNNHKLLIYGEPHDSDKDSEEEKPQETTRRKSKS